MRLEKIEATGSRERVRLCFDDETSLRIPVTVVADLGLSAGMTVTEEELDHIRECAGQASAKLRAVRIIAASGVSERELRRRLVQKGESPDHADRAVEWLSDLNLLDDREAARQIVERDHITTLMVTHNMNQALELGNRTLMMDSGRIVLDVSGEERAGMTVGDLLERFRAGAGKELDNDRILLSE